MKFLLLLLAALPAAASNEHPSPSLDADSFELENLATEVSYNRRHKLADWVFYELGATELRNCADRGDAFRPDPRLGHGDAAQLADYHGSGYDRGHLSPAGDNKWSGQAMDESFLLSNVAPQPPAFNRGIWARLEGLVRAWAKNKGGLWVTTGPVLKEGLAAIGAGRVSVPEYFYKVLTLQNGSRHDSVAFVLPVDARGDLRAYEMPVGRLEAITGVDFLDGLSDEKEVKQSFDASLWDLRASFAYFPCQAISPNDWAWGLSPLFAKL